MKLIDKNTFQYFDIETEKISAYSHKNYYILDSDSALPEVKYIKMLQSTGRYGNFERCVIIEQSESEKANTDSKISKQMAIASDMESYKGYKYRLTTHISIADETNTYHYIYKIGLIENNPRFINYNETGEPVSITSFWNEIKPPILNILSNSNIYIKKNDEASGLMFKLELNPYLTNENIETI